MERDAAAVGKSLATAQSLATTALATTTAGGCNRDHTKVLEHSDVLCRVPRGEMAFVSLANGAYGELGINWAMLLMPILAKVGHEDRAFLFAIDEAGVDAFIGARLPTVRQHTKAKHNERARTSDGFRWEPGAFRDYGVTKAEVIAWLLREGRDVCISDVDAAWVATPYALFKSVPDADVLSGTDCLDVPWDADRSPRANRVKNCGHEPGAQWSAWFNTGVMFFRAVRASAATLALSVRPLTTPPHPTLPAGRRRARSTSPTSGATAWRPSKATSRSTTSSPSTR